MKDVEKRLGDTKIAETIFVSLFFKYPKMPVF